jgi:hypothetical protein
MNIDLTEDEINYMKSLLSVHLKDKLRDDYEDIEIEDLFNLDSSEFKLSLKKVNIVKNIFKKINL